MSIIKQIYSTRVFISLDACQSSKLSSTVHTVRSVLNGVDAEKALEWNIVEQTPALFENFGMIISFYFHKFFHIKNHFLSTSLSIEVGWDLRTDNNLKEIIPSKWLFLSYSLFSRHAMPWNLISDIYNSVNPFIICLFLNWFICDWMSRKVDKTYRCRSNFQLDKQKLTGHWNWDPSSQE